MAVALLQMLTQQKTACDAMLDEKNKLITEYQAVCITVLMAVILRHQAYTGWSKKQWPLVSDS